MTTVTMEVRIRPMPPAASKREPRYCIKIKYLEGDLTFECDNRGEGFDLSDAQNHAFTIKDSLIHKWQVV